MVAATAARAGANDQTRVIDLVFPPAPGQAPFDTAHLVVTGVDHSGPSYEVRLFFNNPEATADTPRGAEQGYIGRYTVFGHGGCYGDEGHCDVPEPSHDPTDLRGDHPLTPLDTYVDATAALQRILAAEQTVHTLTLVPVSITPRRADRAPAPELLGFADISLHTYLAPGIVRSSV